MALLTIDVEKIIAEKNPSLFKRLPKFIIRIIERIIHQKEMNKVLLENKTLMGIDFCRDIEKRWNLDVQLKGVENVPKNGGVIMVANHPLGGFDALAIVTQIVSHRPDIKFIVNDVLLKLENLKEYFVGINKHGASSSKTLKGVNSLFGSDQAVFLFPSGLVSRRIKGKVRDLEWKKTFVSQAKKNNKMIVPVHIEGRLSNFFYVFANLRVALGIKTNIEMLFLADEMFRQKNKKIKITFGKIIDPLTLNNSKTDKQWAQEIMNKVYNL